MNYKDITIENLIAYALLTPYALVCDADSQTVTAEKE